MKQLIISLGREYGSGGRYVAALLAKKLKLKLYDDYDFREMLIKKGVPAEKFAKADEAPRRIFIARSVGRFNNSEEDYIAHLEFNIIKELADSGKSFIVVGRCANEILKEYKCLVSVFIWADEYYRINRIMKMDKCDEEEAIRIMDLKDKKRKTFYNTYSKSGWGEMKSYDITINNAKIGVAKATDLIIDYIKEKEKAEKLKIVGRFIPNALIDKKEHRKIKSKKK